jgi:hypothetical protein
MTDLNTTNTELDEGAEHFSAGDFVRRTAD